MPSSKNKRVDIRDTDTELAKAVLEAAETLAGKPMEIHGLAGRQYFLAPSKELASLCRRWLSQPGRSPSGLAAPRFFLGGVQAVGREFVFPHLNRRA